jgi:phospholipase/carboxylesterase
MSERGSHSLSLSHLVSQPQQANAGAPPLLILLHGVGSNEHDLFGLAPYLDPRFLIVSARAPYVMMPGMYAWFEIGWVGTEIVVDPQQAEASRKLIAQFVQEAAAYSADPGRVYLLGFSQGAIMSAAVALTRPDLVAGAVLMSGRVRRDLLPPLDAEQLVEKPFLVVHGTADAVLPIENGRASRDFLASLPVKLTYKEYRMAHEVSAESLADVVTWLSARLEE